MVLSTSTRSMNPPPVEASFPTNYGWKKLSVSPNGHWRLEKFRLARLSSATGKSSGGDGTETSPTGDPSAHAEIVALREAGTTLANHRLEDCELFATIEPCAMCAGALIHARVKRLIYGADDPKAGAVRSVLQIINHPQLNHRMEVRSGVLAGRSSELLQAFFRNRRERVRLG